MIITKEKLEKYTELKNMIIRAFNETEEEIHKCNKNPIPFRKYAPILTKLANKLIDISKYYEVYNMDDDFINSLNKQIERGYEDLDIIMHVP